MMNLLFPRKPRHATKVLRLAGLVAAIALQLGYGPSAQAAACAGFSDVDSTSTFCSDVEWIKNRGVTVGCAAGLYCPNDTVTRLQMAAFLYRLGQTLTPGFLDNEQSLTSVSISSEAQLCKVGPTNSGGYPLSVTLDAVVSMQANANTRVAVEILQSPDGVTWTPLSTSPTLTDISAAHWTSATDVTSQAVAANSSIQYAVGVARSGSSGSNSLIAARCKLRARAVTRTGIQPPI